MKTISPKAGIIAMTDRNSLELEMQIRRLDMLYYMIKPIDKKYLTRLPDHVEKGRYYKSNIHFGDYQ